MGSPIPEPEETEMTTKTYTIKREPLSRSAYSVLRNGAKIGSLDVRAGGYRDWSFCAGLPRPSQTTLRRLARDVEA